jgi:hypothetical protein
MYLVVEISCQLQLVLITSTTIEGVRAIVFKKKFFRSLLSHDLQESL